ncbi:hypothetical protein D3C84_910990 [compost metagenome]
MAVANSRAKQPGNIGRVWRSGFVQVIVEVVAGAVEEQADVQGLAAWQHHTTTGCHGQGILIVTFLLPMARYVLLNLVCPTGQTPLQRKWRRIADAGMFHFGHD